MDNKECVFRPAGSVDCDRESCKGCGWHPKIEEKRIKAIRKKLKKKTVHRIS